MTTHDIEPTAATKADQLPEQDRPVSLDDRSTTGDDASADRLLPADQVSAADPVPAAEQAPAAEPVHSHEHVPAGDDNGDDALFADDDLSGLRTRWDDVQAAFVDDPAESVQKADGLVAEVVEQLTAGFSQTRSRLEAQWAQGNEASTEDLRFALRRYREFFQRLLTV